MSRSFYIIHILSVYQYCANGIMRNDVTGVFSEAKKIRLEARGVQKRYIFFKKARKMWF